MGPVLAGAASAVLVLRNHFRHPLVTGGQSLSRNDSPLVIRNTVMGKDENPQDYAGVLLPI